MDPLDTLHRLIPYRLQSIETFNLVLRLRDAWGGAQPMQLFINGRLMIEGNSNAFTNPVIETGIIHCRALLEFLGLGVSVAGSLQSLKHPRRQDDVGIEHFSNTDGPLAVVSPEAALPHWPGGVEEAEQALLSVFRAANKGLAHLTLLFAESPEEAIRLEIASALVPALVVRHLYTPLGLSPPKLQITARSREHR